MEIEVAVMEVQPSVAAVARGTARWDNIPEVMIGLMNVAGHHGQGLQVAIYTPAPDGPAIEAGVLVAKPFEDRAPVFCSATPGGIAVMTRHWGPYSGLHEANRMLRVWAREHGHELAGPTWEIYGHWNEDPAKVYTDIYYLLK